MKILIKGGRVIDPASGRDETADIAGVLGRSVPLDHVSSAAASLGNAAEASVAPAIRRNPRLAMRAMIRWSPSCRPACRPHDCA